MTREEILDMAWKAGFPVGDAPDEIYEFAALVAAAEREACAKVCEENMFFATGEHHAKAIRARGEE